MKKLFFSLIAVGVILLTAGFTLSPNKAVASHITVWGAALLIIGGLGLLFGINGKDELKALGLFSAVSATASATLYCALLNLSCYFLSNPARHPIRYPASMLGGLIFATGTVVTFILYLSYRQKHRSRKGEAFNVLCGFILVIPLLFLLDVGETVARKLLFSIL